MLCSCWDIDLMNKGFRDALSKLGDTREVPAELNDKGY